MKPVRLLDAAFLHAETPATPMHVGALFVLERPATRSRKPFYQRFRELVAGRLGDSEVFSRRLARLPLGLANPFWATTHAIDLSHHVRHATLPRPGNLRQLENRVARLHEPLMDRRRPLWELHVIDGLEGGRVALYVKTHHAGLDGHTAQLFLQAFVDTEARARTGSRPLPPADRDSLAAVLLAGASHQAAEIGRLPTRLFELAGAAATLLRSRDAAAPATPRTVLNEVVSGRRNFATAEIDLDDARAVARHARVKVNDVLLAITAGATRRWLLQRGLLPRQPLLAGVPVSARADGDTDHSIQVAFISVALHTGVADPLARLAAIHASSLPAKDSAGTFKALIPDDVPSIGLPWLLGGAAWLVSHPDVADRVPLPFNMVVSNVPGPPVPLFIAGCRVLTYLPVSIVYHGVGLNVTAYSYDGKLFIGLTSCPDLLPDLRSFAAMMIEEFEALKPVRPASKRATRRRKPGRR